MGNRQSNHKAAVSQWDSPEAVKREAGIHTTVTTPLDIGKQYRDGVVPLLNENGLMIHRCTQDMEPAAGASFSIGTPVAPGHPPQIVGRVLEVTPSSAAGVGSAGHHQEVRVAWQMDVPTVFHAADSSRSPCGSNTRLASPAFRLPASTAPPSACTTPGRHMHAPMGHMASPPLRSSPLLRGALASVGPSAAGSGAQVSPASAGAPVVHTAAKTLPVASGNGGNSLPGLWHMEWALFDHNDSHVSLYLCHTPDHDNSSVVGAVVGPVVGAAVGPVAGAVVGAVAGPAVGAVAGAGQMEEGDGDKGEEVEEEEGRPLVVSWHVTVQGLDGQLQEKVHKEAYVPAHDYRTKGAGEACWGFQGLLTLDDLDRLTATQVLRVTARIQFTHMQPFNPLALDPGTQHWYNDGNGIPSHNTAELAPAPMPDDDDDAPPALRVLVASLSPRILVIDEFLTAEECEQLVALATPRLVRSRVSTGTETPSRMSRGTFFTGVSAALPLIQVVEDRIAELVNHPAVIGSKKKLVNTEALQVVSYSKGGFYHGHFDNKAGGPVTRHATIVIYLCDCPAGGGTFFPRATAPPTEQDVPPGTDLKTVADMTQELHDNTQTQRPGVRIIPVMGRAVLFWSALPNGTEDLASLHEAEGVEAGEKWIATRWFKEVDN